MKDTNNLLSYNQWSCGDYNNNLTDFEHVQVSKITNDYCTQGENCVQINRGSSQWWVDIPLSPPSNGDYTITLNILNIIEYSLITIIKYDPSGATPSVISYITVPKSDTWRTVSLSANITDLTNNRIRVLSYGGEVYIDDVSLVSG